MNPNKGAEIQDAHLFSQVGNEEIIREIVSKLLFISKIGPGEKIDTKLLFIRSEGLWNRFIRATKSLFVQGESKEETLLFLEEVIRKAVDLIFYYQQSPNDKFKMNISRLLVTNVEKAKGGIMNLQETYISDPLFGSKIGALLQTTTAKMNSIVIVKE